MALTIFAIGAAGVISMQKTSVMSNVDARRLDTANGISRRVLERLRGEAMTWPASSTSTAAPATTNIAAADGTWLLPAWSLGNTPYVGAFDVFGNDEADIDKAVFCANILLVPVASSNGALPGAGIPKMYRAQVRVFWPRGLGAATPTKFCAAGGGGGSQSVYHFVQATTLIGPAPFT